MAFFPDPKLETNFTGSIVILTEQMFNEAKVDAEHLKVSWGKKTRNATNDRDLIGSLAHQAVEQKFQEYNLPFESYRKVRYTSGDKGDILYDQDLIDVKGTHGELDMWWQAKNFLVFDKEMPSIESKGITHFVFVLVDLNIKEAYVFGAISLESFKNNSKEVRLKWDNHGVTARQLTPFRDYVFRTVTF